MNGSKAKLLRAAAGYDVGSEDRRQRKYIRKGGLRLDPRSARARYRKLKCARIPPERRKEWWKMIHDAAQRWWRRRRLVSKVRLPQEVTRVG